MADPPATIQPATLAGARNGRSEKKPAFVIGPEAPVRTVEWPAVEAAVALENQPSGRGAGVAPGTRYGVFGASSAGGSQPPDGSDPVGTDDSVTLDLLFPRRCARRPSERMKSPQGATPIASGQPPTRPS
jgi:hypothetical protein